MVAYAYAAVPPLRFDTAVCIELHSSTFSESGYQGDLFRSELGKTVVCPFILFSLAECVETEHY